MVDRHAQFETLQNRMVSAEPLRADGERVGQVNVRTAARREDETLAMEPNDLAGVRFDRPPLGAEDEGGLALFDQAPRSGDDEFTLVSRKRPPPPAGRLLRLKVAGDERLVGPEGNGYPGMVVAPLDETEALLRRPPGLPVKPIGFVVGDPCDEVVELVPGRKYGRETEDAAR